VLAIDACDSPTDTLLEATDPDIINPSDVSIADAADALARGAVQRFKQMTAGAGFQQESMWLLGGMLQRRVPALRHVRPTASRSTPNPADAERA
jgi:hypothetical protein